MKRTDARKPESGHAPRSNQPFFGAQLATAFFTPGQSVQRDPFFQPSAPASSVPIQAKLTVGAVGDQYEQEADRVAATVVEQINRPAGPQGSDQAAVQRVGAEEEEVQMMRSPEAIQRVEQEEELQMKPIADTIQRMGPAEEDELQMKPDWLQRETDPAEEDELQMKPIAPQVTAQGGDVSSGLESAIQQARGGGQAIAENVRVPLEQAFGADFSGVRVHTDTKSDQLNQSIQAKAFTTGQNVFFRQGAYQPGSRGGQELIAHELTHVVQQSEEKTRRKATEAGVPSNLNTRGKGSWHEKSTRFFRAGMMTLNISNHDTGLKIRRQPPASLADAIALFSGADIVNKRKDVVVGKRFSGKHGGIELKAQLGITDSSLGDLVECDVHPRDAVKGRGKERLVYSATTGKVWYTDDHYAEGSFREIL